MKKIYYWLLAVLSSTQAYASGFYTEAGVSYTMLRGARYKYAAPPVGAIDIYPPVLSWGEPLQTEDKSKWAPFVAIGYSFTDRFGVRLSYQHVGDLAARTEWRSTLVPGYETLAPVTAPVFFVSYKDKVDVLSLAPELRWPLAEKITLTFAPELNWVSSRGEIQESLLTTTAHPISSYAHNQRKFTPGASVGFLWSMTGQWSLAVTYRYADLEPSWDREAHLLSGTIRFGF